MCAFIYIYIYKIYKYLNIYVNIQIHNNTTISC